RQGMTGRAHAPIRAQRIVHLELQRARRAGCADAAARHVNLEPLRIGDAAWGAQVTRCDHRWKAPLPRTFGEPSQRVVDDYLEVHLATRRDVPDFLRKQARAVLLQQRSALTLEQSLFVALASDLPCLDDPDNPLTGDIEREPTHGTVRG